MVASASQADELSADKRSPYRKALALLVVAAGSFYVATLDWHGYWQDEIKTVQAGRLSFSGMIEERANSGHQPVYFVLSFFWQQWFGESERALRLPATLFGLMSLVALFLIVESLVDARTAFLAALLLALSPLQIFLCQMARMYTLVQLLSLATTYILIQERVTWRLAGIFTVLWAVNLYTHFSAYLVLAAHSIYLAFSPSPRRNLLGGVVLAIGMHLNWLLLFPEINAAEQHLGWLPELELLPSLEVVNALALGNYFVEVGRPTAGLFISIVFMCMALFGIQRIWRCGRLLALLWLAPYGVALILSTADLNLIRINRYFSTSIAAQAALVGVCLTAPRNRYVQWLSTTAVLATMILGIGLSLTRHPIPPPWREMAAIIRERGATDEIVFVVGDPTASPFRHYFGDDYVQIDSPDEALPQTAKGIWLCTPARHKNLGRQIMNRLRERFTYFEYRSLPHGELFHVYAPIANRD